MAEGHSIGGVYGALLLSGFVVPDRVFVGGSTGPLVEVTVDDDTAGDAMGADGPVGLVVGFGSPPVVSTVAMPRSPTFRKRRGRWT